MNNKILFILSLIALSLIVSCSLGGGGQANQNNASTGVVYVLNQGTFGQGNASVTGYDPVTGIATQNVYSSRNKKPIGDTIEGATLIGNRLYIIVNGSNKIEVVDPNTMQQLGSITFANNPSPWQIVKAGDNLAYVTEFYNASVAFVNLNTLQVINTMPVGTYPEGISVSNGKAFIAVSGLGRSDSLAVVNTANSQILNYIGTADNPTVVKTDGQGRIWVVCTGNYGYDAKGNYNSSLETFGKIYVIDAASGNVLKVIDVGGHPDGLALIDQKSEALINNNGIQVIDMQQLSLKSGKLLDRNFYAIATDPNIDTPVLYGAVVTDYTSAGHTILYNLGAASPVAADSFSTGINPGSFSFIPR